MNRLGGARRGLAALALIGILAGCQTLAEQERAAAEERRASCLEAGFAEGTDAYRLCLLLERTNERLARVERRLELLDSELTRVWAWGPWRRWP